MVKQGVNKIRILAVASLVAVALVSAPAKANHDHSIAGPVAALILLGAMVHHGHHRNYNNHYRPHHSHNHHRRHGHSYSHGGYHNRKRNHYKRR